MSGNRAHNGPDRDAAGPRPAGRGGSFSPSGLLNGWLDSLAPCPWPAHTGSHIASSPPRRLSSGQLYSREERARRDTSPWTTVQAVLAPLQFLVFAISLVLVVRFLMTGEGYDIATASILAKTFLLYLIMITGSIWEKEVFGKWLFAPTFLLGRRGQHGGDRLAQRLSLRLAYGCTWPSRTDVACACGLCHLRRQRPAILLQAADGATRGPSRLGHRTGSRRWRVGDITMKCAP